MANNTGNQMFKDMANINHRNLAEYLENISLLADAVRGEKVKDGVPPLIDKSNITLQPHNPNHVECTPFGIDDTTPKLTEKRMCKCMYYYNIDEKEKQEKQVTMCQKCLLERKWKNVSDDIKIIECEIPTEYVVKTVGGIDLILKDKNGIEYSTEVKPENSKESLVRMMAEAYTMKELGVSNKKGKLYKPAICFFKESVQGKDFCKPGIYNNDDFQYLLGKIDVFYITTGKEEGNIVEFKIHDNRLEPLNP